MELGHRPQATGHSRSKTKYHHGGTSPATGRLPEDVRLAVWQAGWRGLHWLDELVKARKAIDLGGDGYPCRYTVIAEHVIPQIADAPPEARATWASGDSDVITDKWEGKTVIDHVALERCRADEWLLIEAWDES